MEKSFVGFGPGSSPLPVRSPEETEALIQAGRGRAALRQLFGLAAGLAGGNVGVGLRLGINF